MSKHKRWSMKCGSCDCFSWNQQSEIHLPWLNLAAIIDHATKLIWQEERRSFLLHGTNNIFFQSGLDSAALYVDNSWLKDFLMSGDFLFLLFYVRPSFRLCSFVFFCRCHFILSHNQERCRLLHFNYTSSALCHTNIFFSLNRLNGTYKLKTSFGKNNKQHTPNVLALIFEFFLLTN